MSLFLCALHARIGSEPNEVLNQHPFVHLKSLWYLRISLVPGIENVLVQKRGTVFMIVMGWPKAQSDPQSMASAWVHVKVTNGEDLRSCSELLLFFVPFEGMLAEKWTLKGLNVP